MTFGDFPLSWARIVQQPVTGCVAGTPGRRDHRGGSPYIRTSDLLHAMQHGFVWRRRVRSGYRRPEPLRRL